MIIIGCIIFMGLKLAEHAHIADRHGDKNRAQVVAKVKLAMLK